MSGSTPTTRPPRAGPILRVDPDSTRAALLSLPRDLLVSIPGFSGRRRINEAVNRGGPSLLVQTIQNAFSIPIHHYVELDFRGFYEVVDAIGGVPVYFPEPARDRSSGLDIPEPGCVTLDPQMALNYVRSRFYDVFRDGRWQRDPRADLGRIERQQDFIRRAMRRAIDRGVRNPAVLHDLLDATLPNLIVDDRLRAGDLLDLAMRFRNFNPENLDMYSVPVVDDVVNGQQVLRLRQAEARPILDVFRGVEDGVLAPEAVMVTVRNGTGRPGHGAEVAAELRAAGFTVPDAAVEDADRFDYARTTVLAPAGLLDAAELLASALAAGADVVETDDPAVTGIELIVGADYSGASRPPPAPPSTETAGRPRAGQDPGPPTSTVVGQIPMNPPDVAC